MPIPVQLQYMYARLGWESGKLPIQLRLSYVVRQLPRHNMAAH